MKVPIFTYAATYRKSGAVLLVCLLMLVVILLLGISTAQIALQEEKTSRNVMDRQIAFQAAEAALSDAEMDIQGSPDLAKSRSHLFSSRGMSGLPEDADFICGVGLGNNFLGVCNGLQESANPIWKTLIFLSAHRQMQVRFLMVSSPARIFRLEEDHCRRKHHAI